MNKIGFDVFFLPKNSIRNGRPPSDPRVRSDAHGNFLFSSFRNKKSSPKNIKTKSNPRSHVVVFLNYSIFERNANHFSSPYTQKNVCINFQGLPVNRSPTFSRVFLKNRNKKKLFLLFGLT
jgi:hypothetical protein